LSLEGSWTIETLAVGGELVKPLDGGKPLTLEVDGERASGSAGVNRFVGGVGDDRVFSNLVTTRMAGPEILMAQEAILLAHLESVDSVESSDSARLLLADGLIVLTLAPAGTNHIFVTS
jgi:heat shock protein HslJ